MTRVKGLGVGLATVIALGVPSAAMAQGTPAYLPPPPPGAAPWGAPPPPPPQGPAAPVAMPLRPEIRYDPSPGTRWVLEGLGGAGMGTAFMLAGGLVMYAAVGGGEDNVLRAVRFGSALGTFGVPLGVLLVGRSRGGNGGYGWSLLGTMGGNLVANLVTLLTFPECYDGCTGALAGYLALGLALPAFGAVLAYELSNDQNDLPPPRAVGLRLVPALQLTREGAAVGVGAAF